MDIKTVQHWVVSVIVCAICMVPMGAMVGLAHAVAADGRTGAAVLLCAMSGVIGVVMVTAVLLIHQRRPVSPLLLVGLLPAVLTAWWVL